MQIVGGLHLRVLLLPVPPRFRPPLPLLILRGRARGRTRAVPLPLRVGERGRMHTLLLEVIQPTLGLVLGSPRGNVLRLTSVLLFTGSLRPKRRLSVMNGHGRKKPRRRVAETLFVLPWGTLTLPVLLISEASARREPSAIFITLTLVSVRLSSAPATSSNQTTGSSSAGPVIVDSPNTGFVNSILRRAAPAFTPGPRSEAKGSASR